MEVKSTGTDMGSQADKITVYEVSYLLLPSIAGEQIPAKAEALKNTITSVGGVLISDEDPVLIDLAYPMTKVVGTTRHKENKGYFGWVKFELESSIIEKVKKAFDADPSVIRFLPIKTVRENTLLNGKMKFQKEENSRRIDEGEAISTEEVPEVTKEVVTEELDKSIDDLVIV